jgi:acyl dehydratase
MRRLFFEDFSPGATATHPGPTVTKDEIIAFAREFDPQPFHIDEEAAKASFAGGLIASGWHTCALNMRMVADSFLLQAASMGAPGIEEVRWLLPVRPGDSLVSRRTVLETRESRSRPEMGLARFLFEVLNQRGETVMTQTNWIMLGRRDAPAVADVEGPAVRRTVHQEASEGGHAAPPARGDDDTIPFLEDLVVGETRELGAYRFAAEETVRYAQLYDPQPFHTDPEAARCSHFGGLCASGWHTAAIWMKLLVADLGRAAAAARHRGERPARLGSSPGFKNLKWLKPVYAGDTIAFSATTIDTRASASRPGWGLAFQHNTGVNQHGEEVFSFDGSVFWERRPDSPRG